MTFHANLRCDGAIPQEFNDHAWFRSRFTASRGGAPLSIIGQYAGQQQRPA